MRNTPLALPYGKLFVGLLASVCLSSTSVFGAPILFTQTIVVNNNLNFTLFLSGNGATPNAIDAVTKTNALSVGAGAVWVVDYTVEGTADGAGFLKSVNVEGEATHQGFSAPGHPHAGITGATFDFDLTIRAGNAAPNLRLGEFAGNPENHHLDHNDIYNIGLRGVSNVSMTRILTWDLTLSGHHDLPNEIAEPATLVCLASGLAGLVFWRTKRRVS
jgi:hypothetical protein